MSIHPTAIVDSKAEIDATAEVGPYVVIDGPVRIGAGTRVYPHAYLTGHTEIGANCRIHPGAVVGHEPQDLAYEGAETYCRIGDETIIREGATIHRGTGAGSATEVGKRCFIMAGAHVGHNCHIGDDVKITNGAMLGGHVQVGDGAFLSGNAGVHQFVRVGELVMVGGMQPLLMDAPPYFLVAKGRCAGINVVGLRRAGFTPEQRADVKLAYRILYRSGAPFREAVERMADEVTTEAGQRIVAFLRAPSRRGIVSATRDDEQ